MLERLQIKLLHLQGLEARQRSLCCGPMMSRQEGDRHLPGQKHLLGPLVGGQPVLDLSAVWQIAPVAGEEKPPELGGCEG